MNRRPSARARICAASLALACVAHPLAAQAASIDATEREALELKSAGRYRESFEKVAAVLNRVLEAPEIDDVRSARAEFLLAMLGNLAQKVPDHEGLVTILDGLSTRSSVERRPVLRGRIEHLAAQHLRFAGRIDDARRRIDRLGYIRDFAVLGPLDNERGSRFGFAYDVEKTPRADFDLDKPVAGKKRPVRWRRTNIDRVTLGELDLGARLRPATQSLAYLAFAVSSEVERDICLRFGSTGSVAVFAHGAEVFRRDIQSRPIGFDQDVCAMRVRAGRTLVLIKVCTQSGGFAFRGRLTTIDGKALQTEEVTTAELAQLRDVFKSETEGASFDAKAQTKPARGAVAFLEVRIRELEAEKPAADSPQARQLGMHAFRLAYMLALRAPDDEAQRRDRRYATIAAQYLPKFGIAHFVRAFTLIRRGASNADREENARRQALEAAIAAWPRSAESMRALAALERETMGADERAEAWLVRAFAINPQYVYACTEKLDLLDGLGFSEIRARTLEELRAVPELATHPAILDVAIELARERDARKDEIRLLEQRLSREYELGSLLRLARALRQVGRSEDARARYDQAIAHFPASRSARAALAAHHVAKKQLDAACAVWNDWLRICPEDSAAHNTLARLYQRLGKAELEIAEIRSALALNPNLKSARRRLDWLEKGTVTFYSGLEIDADEIRKADKGPDADASTAGDSHYYAFRHRIVRAYANGTTSTYDHFLVKVLNEEGATTFDTFRAPYGGGNPSSRILEARVIKADGSFERARLGYTRYVDLPPIRAGDWVEVAVRVDDRTPTFFGQYFGYTHLFPADEPVPVRLSRLDLLLDAGRTYRFQSVGQVPEAEVRKRPDGVQHRSWIVRDLRRRSSEFMSPSLLERGPLVRCSTYDSWDSFAAWWWNLIRKQTAITPEIRAKVRELVEGLPTVEAKVQRIYDFVITEIQYEAWEFGVHGYKPYSVASIFARRFGDCKDKSILLNAMLGEIGVRAYPVLINAERNRDRDDLTLPMVEHFNHCISYVPAQRGMPERFLDGTAQYHPLNTLPGMDRGAKVLVVEGAKGKGAKGRLADVPWTRAEENRDTRSYRVELRADGSARVRYEREASGEFGPRLRDLYVNRGERRDEALEEEVGGIFGQARLVSAEYSRLDDLTQDVRIQAKIEVAALASRDGDAFRLPVVFRKERIGRLTPSDKRSLDLVLSTPSSRVSTLRYVCPKGYRFVDIPKSIAFVDKVGAIKLDIKAISPNAVEIRYERSFGTARVATASYARFKELTETAERAESLELRMEKVR